MLLKYFFSSKMTYGLLGGGRAPAIYHNSMESQSTTLCYKTIPHAAVFPAYCMHFHKIWYSAQVPVGRVAGDRASCGGNIVKKFETIMIF